MSEYANHEVIDRIKALLPGFAERARRRRTCERSIRRTSPSSARPASSSSASPPSGVVTKARHGDLLHRGDDHRDGLPVDRVVRRHPRDPQLAPGAVPAAGPGGGLGRGPDRAHLLLVRPDGRGQKTADGLVLNGKVVLVLRHEHADWVFVGGPVLGENDKMVDFCTFLVEKSQYEILDVWHVAGLKGTGSNDILVKDAIIPEHRVLSFGPDGRDQKPGPRVQHQPDLQDAVGHHPPPPSPRPSSAWRSAATGCIASTSVTACARRVRYRRQGTARSPSPLAEAAGDIDAAWLQLMRNVREGRTSSRPAATRT